MKFRVDKYAVFNKGRTYQILVFPRMENAWAFDDFPEDDQLMLDGDTEFFQLLQKALAILIADPSKIIYMPIKHPGETRYGAHMTYDAVLLRPELQLRRSEWYDLKAKLDKQHYAGKYKTNYNAKKINDWWDTLSRKKPWVEKTFYEQIVENLLGDTVFLVLPRDACYMYHSHIASTLEDFDEGYDFGLYASVGYIIPKAAIQKRANEIIPCPEPTALK